MGSNLTGSSKIRYLTKQKIPGKNRFPQIPDDQRQIQQMFEKCLRQIQTTPQQLEILKDFNFKYKFRFVILHSRKIQEYKQKYQLDILRKSAISESSESINTQEKKKKDLQQKMKILQGNQSSIKMNLGAIDRYISQKNAWQQFIMIDGIHRLMRVLNKAIQLNKQGTKTIFQNQIEILKFLKSISDHQNRQYLKAIAIIPDYPIILLRGYHSVNVAVTAYVLLLLQQFAWKVQHTKTIIQVLQQYQLQNQYSSFLDPFTQTIYQTDNILMCYYNMKFINEVFLSIVDDEEKKVFEEELMKKRYQLLIEDIKSKLQQNYFKIEYCTFIYINQKIYKQATRTKKQTKQAFSEALVNRGTMNLQVLQQHLLGNFVDNLINAKNQIKQNIDMELSDDDDDYILVFLSQSDKKNFNKFVLDTFSQIQHYYKYTIIIDQLDQTGGYEKVPQQVQNIKKYGLSIQQYMKRIKALCMKNDCQAIMLSCLKSIQYFQKSQWKKLQNFVTNDIKANKGDTQMIKKTLQQKQKQLKTARKELFQLKSQMINQSKDYSQNNVQNIAVNKLDMNLLLQNQNGIKSQSNGGNSGNIAGLGFNNLNNVLPPPPGLLNINNSQFKLPIPPNNSSNLSILPSPESLNNPIIVPLSLNTQILPPPPSLNGPILPPPPSLNGSMLPTPPSLNGPILPPPPSLNGPILPPPPSLNGLILSVPQSTSSNNSVLPPPPSLNGIGLPPPPITGIPNLSTNNSLPSLPGLSGLPAIPGLPGLNFSNQKLKQKKKPNVPLKACNYATLAYDKIVDTIFQKIDDTKIKIDESQLQKLFSKIIKQAPKDIKTQSAVVQVVKKQTVKLLGADRWRNFQIVLTKLKIPQGGITQALTQCSGKYATINILQSVSKLLPSEEQQMNVKSYEGDLQDLGKPQKFLKQLVNIPEYSNRVKSMLFANNKDEVYFEQQKRTQDLISSYDSLKGNYRLHYVLQVALAIGNYLNGTGLKGGAWGFKLQTLQRMQQVKSNDNKINAGFYLIKQVWKKYSYPIFDKQQIQMYQLITKMPINQLRADLAQIKKNCISVQKAYKSKNPKNHDDRIAQYCQQMVNESKNKYQILKDLLDKAQKSYNQCATFYCQDPTKGSSDQIGKKIFKSILFIFNSQKVFYEIEQKRKKQEARKAPKVEIKFNEIDEKIDNNPESNSKVYKPNQTAIKMPMPSSLPPIPLKTIVKQKQVAFSQNLKQYEKNQQERQKKFLQQMMKKRNSKMVAYRQSRMPTIGNNGVKANDNTTTQIDFLKGL